MARKTQEIIDELYHQIPKGDIPQVPFKVEFSQPYKKKNLRIFYILYI